MANQTCTETCLMIRVVGVSLRENLEKRAVSATGNVKYCRC